MMELTQLKAENDALRNSMKDILDVSLRIPHDKFVFYGHSEVYPLCGFFNVHMECPATIQAAQCDICCTLTMTSLGKCYLFA